MDKEKASKLARMFFSFASNRPRFYGVYKAYVRDDIDELLAHYEHDLNDACPFLDADDITRLAQALYILKSDQYENIMWRVETRINELKDDLEPYHVTNVLRSFSRSQNNRMNGEDKTFYNLEPVILKNIDSISDRDLTHLMYAYSIRAAGNPELYAAFDKKLGEIADRLDYPGLFNAIYYLLFRESKCQDTWDKIIDATINQDETLPITYYRPFKASYFYLKGALPETKFLREY